MTKKPEINPVVASLLKRAADKLLAAEPKAKMMFETVIPGLGVAMPPRRPAPAPDPAPAPETPEE